MIKGFTLEHNGKKKEISFEYNGKINEKQKRYFNALFDSNLRFTGKYDEYSYWGAFRCAKSFSEQTAVYMLCMAYPGLKALYIRDTYDQLEATVIKQFLEEFEYLEAFRYLPSGTPKRCATFKNNSTLLFRSFDKDTDILSSEYDLIAGCQAEDFNQDLFLQLIGRASGRILGDKGIILMEGNPAAGWAKERYEDPSRAILENKRIFAITNGETNDNPFVTEAYKKSLIDNYPKFWLDRYFYGLWDNREELIVSEFNENQHVMEAIDPGAINTDFKRRNGFDWGWVNPCANLWGFTDYDGILTVYDEFYQNKTLPEDVSLICNKHGRIITVADHSMKGLKLPTREDENKTIWTELEADHLDKEGKINKGMLLMPCNKEELSNIVLTNTLFKNNRIKITRNCVNLIREIKNWKWKRLKLGADKNLLEEPTDKDNHTCDALNYLVAELFDKKSKHLKEENEFKKSFQYHVQQINTDKSYQSS